VQYSHRAWATHEVRVVEMYLNETYSKDRTGKHFIRQTCHYFPFYPTQCSTSVASGYHYSLYSEILG
jgi:hypothetical protein